MSPHKDGFKPVISIILPVFNQAAMTTKCFASIRANIKVPYEVVWVDNGSSPGEFAAIKRQAVKPRVHTKLISFPDNIGFIKATNAGIREAEGKYVLLLNNDTEVGWQLAKRLIRPMEVDPKVAATGPVTDSNIAWQGIVNLNRRWDLKLPVFKKNTHEYSKMMHQKYGAKCIEVGGRKLPLSFFCCCMRRSLFKDIGYLDEAFGIGLADDDDMAIRMAIKKYKQMLVLGAFCRHHHRTTFRALKLELDSIRRHNIGVLKRNIKKYERAERKKSSDTPPGQF
jgi:GT2 family glycosyltransferase